MKKEIETERLIMREMVLSDAEGMFELDSDPEVVKYVWIDTVKEIKESENLIIGLKSNIEKMELVDGL